MGPNSPSELKLLFLRKNQTEHGNGNLTSYLVSYNLKKKNKWDNKTFADWLNTNSVFVSIIWLIVSFEQVWFLYLFALESICGMRLVLFIEC